VTGRAASGVKLVNLGDKDELIGISKVIASEEDESGEEGEASEPIAEGEGETPSAEGTAPETTEE